MHRIIEENKVELIRLCVAHRVRRLALFGSAATEHFDPASSDLDFLVEFRSMPPADHAEHFFGLMEDMQKLFALPVDLVESAPIRNPYFRAAIEASRVDLYDAA